MPVPPGDPSNTRLQLRALQDLPAGEEITLSYFPLHWSLEERQQHCQGHYSFRCTCLRCQEEATWVDPETLMSGSEDEDEGMDVEGPAGLPGRYLDESVPQTDALAPGAPGPDPAPLQGTRLQGTAGEGADHVADVAGEGISGPYIQLFLLKYMCPEVACFGTLAPRPGEGRSECNVCGKMRTDQQFMAEVEALAAVGAS
eukprot:jgi/Botrbrau1/427/Bobra.110_2s0077.1